MGKIAVFCSASPVENEKFVNAAKELGRLIGLRKDTLIYGGASLGLMETVASAVKEYGGCVTGVVPEIIEERNAVSGLCDSIIKVKDLNERKQEMNRLADLFVALPGGIGTLDELFTVAAAVSIGYMDKKTDIVQYRWVLRHAHTVCRRIERERLSQTQAGRLFHSGEKHG